MQDNKTDIIVGRNSINEALRSGKTIEKIFISKGEKKGTIIAIISKAREQGIVIKEVDKHKLDFLSCNNAHQGIVAITSEYKYSEIDDIFNLAKEKKEQPFIIIADSIKDPHNLGAIIRTAECAGAHGVVISKHNSAGLSITACKASAGAVEYIPVVKVTNITKLLVLLKEKNIWVFGTDACGEPLNETDFSGAVAIVVGSEGKGISRLVKEQCDKIVSLPLKGKIESLNASVAAGVVMYEVARQRAI